MIIGGFPEPIRQWGKAFLILFFAHRYGAQCTAVEGVVHRENMPVPSFIISVPPSQFHGTFQCLCSAVTEKNTIQSGDFYQDRKSTRLNSSHVAISYAVFCLKKKNTYTQPYLAN